LEAFLQRVKEHVRARGAFLIKVEPDARAGYAGEEALKGVGAFKTEETIQPPNTIHIDLTAPLDTILGRMKSKWRYNIRLAERKGVVVREGNAGDFGKFYELMKLTGERDSFAIHGESYYRTAFEQLHADDHARVFVADYEQHALAMIFVTAFADEAIYLYGASGNAERNRMPNHALHWAAIQWAKERGCARYDLWGVPETVQENGEEDASLPSSLYQFKQGFGGEVVRYTGAWDIVFNPALYRVYKFARRLRREGVG
jgi:lipid II:glycine glycyltransferase (peptidoglycan interpeptide bridge formation enzyme)